VDVRTTLRQKERERERERDSKVIRQRDNRRAHTRSHSVLIFFILLMEEGHSFSASRDQNVRSHFCRKNVLRIKLIKNRVLKRNDFRQCVCDIIFGFPHELLALCVEVPITTTTH